MDGFTIYYSKPDEINIESRSSFQVIVYFARQSFLVNFLGNYSDYYHGRFEVSQYNPGFDICLY